MNEYFKKLGEEVTGKRSMFTGNKIKKKKVVKRSRKRFVGSWGVFWLWIIFFLPIAIIYYFCNYEK